MLTIQQCRRFLSTSIILIHVQLFQYLFASTACHLQSIVHVKSFAAVLSQFNQFDPIRNYKFFVTGITI